MDKKKIVVLGGGISGLTAAYTLCKEGFNVTVIEKNDFAGGLAATFSHDNHLLDYGPHNFHTHNPEVLKFVRDELLVPLNRMPITSSRLFFMGKFIDYPLKIADAIKNLDWKTSARCMADYIVSRIRLKFSFGSEERSFEDWIRNRFGGYIYDLYFGPYIKKVWGLSGSELDAVIARKRIPEPSLFSMIVRAISGMKHGKKHSEDPESVDSYYPPRGIGMITDRLKESIIERGGKVDLGCKLISIDSGERGGKKSIQYIKDGAKKIAEWDYIVSTIPINDLFSSLTDEPARKMDKDVAMLPYRSIILLYIFLSIEKVFDVPWIYFNEKDNPELIFNRMYEIGNFSPEMIHKKNGVICLEITCYKGDELWRKSDGELFEICMRYLEKNNFLKRENVRSIMTKRLDVAYPVFKKGYRLHLTNVINFLIERGDIFCVGRQGLFSYANVDHCIDMGLKASQLFDAGKPRPEKFYDIYEDYLY